jgi:hypothetical protein
MANPRRARGALAALLSAATAWMVISCGADDTLALCGTIPSGGCPIGRGGTCDDPSCSGVYDCVDGRWRATERCPGGGASDAGSLDGGEGDAGDAGCAPIVIDHADESGGCAPQLEEPDCPAVAAEQCAVTACLTGCIDFFLCTANGWRAVAYCDDSGHVVLDR